MPKFIIKDVCDYPLKNYLYTGVRFWCPGCDSFHIIAIKKAPNYNIPVWTMSGSGDNLTFTPSIKVTYRHPKGYSNENPAPINYDGPYVDDICHSYVKNGMIQFLNDCFHELKGKTVPLPDIPSLEG